MSDLFNSRIKWGNEYVSLYSQISELDWTNLYEKYDRGILSVPEAMILVHPDFFQNISTLSSNDEKEIFKLLKIHETDNFKDQSGLDRKMKCQSQIIWGESCPIDEKSYPLNKIEFDHHFPKSFGGPTVPSNRIFLCNFHNQKIKTADIHLYSWEAGEPQWLRDQINKIAKFYNVK